MVLGKFFSTSKKQEAEPPEQQPAPAHNYVILRDEMGAGDHRATIEVSTDSIKLTPVNGEPAQSIPLNPEAADYNAVDEDVRAEIARKIARMVPALPHSKKNELTDYTLRVIRHLAHDHAGRVRRMIAEELKDTPNAPKELIGMLAWDPDFTVSCPVLEFSPLLGDQELLEIIATSPMPGVLEAIAKRKSVTEKVSHALVVTAHSQTIHALLSNPGAKFDDESMDTIIDMAPEQEVWHETLVKREDLPKRAINRIASFVSTSMLLELEEAGMLPASTRRNLTHAMSSRLKSDYVDREREAWSKAEALHAAGKMNSDLIIEWLDKGWEEHALAGIALQAKMTFDKTKRIIKSQSPRAVTALAWKAGLPMRTALQLQLKNARIPHTKVLLAREGIHYPLSEQEMQTYLEFFAD